MANAHKSKPTFCTLHTLVDEAAAEHHGNHDCDHDPHEVVGGITPVLVKSNEQGNNLNKR